MKIAYLILIHNNFAQFQLLFESIYHKDNIYLIHVDKKSENELHNSVKKYLSSYSNAYIMKSRICNWGGFSMVDIQMKGIKKLLQISNDWDFFINLSGQDFPLKSQPYIMEFLDKNRDKNFIDAQDQHTRKELLSRIRLFCFEIGKYFIKTRFKRKYLKGIKPYYGSQWFIFNKDFCKFLTKDNKTQKILKFYKNTFIPDEGFFQTAIMNSDFCSTVINDYKRIVSWQKGSIKPRILKIDDLEYLLNNENFFARKFDINEDIEIINKLKKETAA
ncbi:MAG: beta-1,6-N-acetylglucosaminyltransferase [Candidatus Gastranaerophilales bacterium]|nr:beta-1,6-N-acetylglucosaminyltransferase [Candidatus Gastranaerophilales bacterium]